MLSVIDRFLNTIEGKTKAAYTTDLRVYAAFVCDDFENVHPLQIVEWLQSNTSLSPATRNRRLSAIKTFYKWASLYGFVSPALAAQIVMIKGLKANENKLPQVVTQTQITTLLRLARESGGWWYCLVVVALTTGLRVSELVALKWGHIDWDTLTIRVTGGKGNKDRVVFFNQQAAEALHAQLPRVCGMEGVAVFRNSGGNAVSTRWVEKKCTEWGEAMGMTLTPHMLRHTFATAFLNQCGDIAALADVLGHSKIETTRIYTKTATGRLSDVYQKAMGEWLLDE